MKEQEKPGIIIHQSEAQSVHSSQPRGPIEWMRWIPAGGLALLFLFALFISVRIILIPLLSSLALSYLLAPIVSWFERRGWSRPSSVLLTMTASALALILVVIFLLPSFRTQMAMSYDKVLLLAGNLPERKQALKDRLNPSVYQFLESQLKRLDDPQELARLRDLALGWLQSGWFRLVDMTSSILDLLLIPFFVYYLLTDYRSMRNKFDLLIPPRYRAITSDLMSKVNEVLSTYVRNQLLIALSMAVLYSVGFYALSVPLAITLGLVSGLLNFLPYVGTLSGLVLSLSFVALDETKGTGHMIGVVLIFILVQSFEGYYLTPKLLGSRLNLHPLWVLAGLMIGGNLFGLIGIILAVPAIAVAKVLLRFLEELYQSSTFYRRAGLNLLTDQGEPIELIISSDSSDPSEENLSQPTRRTIITTAELRSRLKENPPNLKD